MLSARFANGPPFEFAALCQMLGCKEKDNRILFWKREKFWQPKKALLCVLIALLQPSVKLLNMWILNTFRMSGRQFRCIFLKAVNSGSLSNVGV